MSQYKPYPAYKDSGVEWLDAIPDNWEISRLGFEAWVRARLGWKGLKAEEYVDDGYAFLSTPDIKGTEIDFSDVNFITEERYEESPEIKLAVGDVLLAKDGSTLGTVNVVRKLPRAATVNSSIAVITPFQRLTPLYLHYLFKGSYLENTIQVLKGGMGVPHLFQWDINKFKIPLPSMLEQAEIAAHLDRETARIDALIEKKTRFIELLREKRQALITHAVTKGLDPHVKMKDSGVEWLGEVPEHWEVKRLKFIATVQTGIAKGKDNAGRDTVEVPYLRVANVQDGYLDLDEVSTIEVSTADLPRYLLQPGDVLMNEGGDFDKLGRGHVWQGEIEPCIHQNHVFSVRPHGVSSEWLNTFTSSVAAQFYFMGRSKQSTNLASISSRNLMALAVPLPSEDEQRIILIELGRQTAKLNAIGAKTERSIELLKERRSALITAAVTGQIDLREQACL